MVLQSTDATSRDRRDMRTTAEHRANPFRRLDVRLALGVLAVSLPVMAGIAGLLVAQSSESLTSAAENKAASMSRAVARSLERWTEHRQRRPVGRLPATPRSTAELALGANSRVLISGIDRSNGDAFALIEVTNLAGEVLASSRPRCFDRPERRGVVPPRRRPVRPSYVSPVERDGRIDWVIAQPIVDADGQPVGVVVGYLQRRRYLSSCSTPSWTRTAKSSPSTPSSSSIYETDHGSGRRRRGAVGRRIVVDDDRQRGGRQWSRG